MLLPATKIYLVSLDHRQPIIGYRITLEPLLNNNFHDTNTVESTTVDLESRTFFHVRSGL